MPIPTLVVQSFKERQELSESGQHNHPIGETEKGREGGDEDKVIEKRRRPVVVELEKGELAIEFDEDEEDEDENMDEGREPEEETQCKAPALDFGIQLPKSAINENHILMQKKHKFAQFYSLFKERIFVWHTPAIFSNPVPPRLGCSFHSCTEMNRRRNNTPPSMPLHWQQPQHKGPCMPM
jgi:hypothetical protein